MINIKRFVNERILIDSFCIYMGLLMMIFCIGGFLGWVFDNPDYIKTTLVLEVIMLCVYMFLHILLFIILSIQDIIEDVGE